jgi:phosphate transport system protein
MSHYEERMEKDLERLHDSVAEMANRVEAGVKDAVRALLAGDRELATATILSDHWINRAMTRIDKLCHSFIAQHLPSGRHLRLLSSVIRVNIELERIGDYAVTIAREAVQLSAAPSGGLAQELERYGNETQVMLHQAISAFKDLNADVARATMILEEQMENDLDVVYAKLTANEDRDAVRNLVNVFAVFTQLKRVVDQAKNLCEETVFAATGETKAPKVYNILFVDEDNSCLSPLAVAVASKHFPGSGHYTSAGRTAASELNPALVAFLDQRNLRLAAAGPERLNLTPLELAGQHLVISLEGPVKSYFSNIPFHTTPLQWDLAPPPTEEAAIEGWLDEIYRDLATRIRDLMETLRGEDAP